VCRYWVIRVFSSRAAAGLVASANVIAATAIDLRIRACLEAAGGISRLAVAPPRRACIRARGFYANRRGQTQEPRGGYGTGISCRGWDFDKNFTWHDLPHNFASWLILPPYDRRGARSAVPWASSDSTVLESSADLLGERDEDVMMRRMPSVFGGALFGSALSAVGLRELRQLKTAMAVRGPHHCDVGAVEPDD
jgi:hypothetical protein